MRAKTVHRLRSAVAGVAVVGLGAGAALITGSAASADPVSLTLDYTCGFPLIGDQSMQVEINSDMPASVEVNEETGNFQLDAVATVNEASRAGLRAVGAETLEGTVAANAHLALPNLDLPVVVDLTIEQTPIPAETGGFDVNATGQTTAFSFTEENVGTGTITVNDLVLTITPRNANGDPTGLGTFDVECGVGDGQDQTLHTFEVVEGGGTTTTSEPSSTTEPPSTSEPPSTTEPPTSTTQPGGVEFAYDLTGESFIQAANGTVPLTGRIDADFDLASGTYQADLTLNPTSGTFSILGFLGVDTEVEFEQVGQTSGSLTDGVLTSSSEMNVKLPSILAYGLLPLGGGEECQSVSPATIELSSPEGETFDPLAGGTLEGTYTLPALQGCGWLNDIISLFVAGPNNTISLELTPAA